MKLTQLVTSCFFLLTCSVHAANTNIDQLELANQYAKAWFKTQMPDATKADLEHYLSFLTDDVAYQHLPYDKTDDREEGGKEILRQGMGQWLASSTHYEANVNSINFSNNIITINYDSLTKISDAKTNTERVIRRHIIDTLELENGKVSVIRKYW